MENNWQDLLTWWESREDSLRVECYHYRGAFRVRALHGLLPSEMQRVQGRPGARCTRGPRAKVVCGAREPQVQADTLRPSPREWFTAYTYSPR